MRLTICPGRNLSPELSNVMSGLTPRLLRDEAPFDLALDDGLRVCLRPIVKSDEARVQRAYELLSEDSRMNRFWEKPKELSLSRAARLTDTDDAGHVAWIAIRPDDEDFPGYAGGSFWRDAADASRAELAFTVADAWQRQGLATLLFSILWFDGWYCGIRHFYGSCRLKNVAMAEWWHDMGGAVNTADRHYQLSMDLLSPQAFINQVSYEMASSYRRVETADWMRKWLEITADRSI